MNRAPVFLRRARGPTYRGWVIGVLLSALSLLSSLVSTAQAFELLTTTSAREALNELVPLFELANKTKVNVSFSPGSKLAERIATGPAADVLIAPSDFADGLVRDGLLEPDNRVAFAKSLAALAVKQGAPKPDIRSAEGLKSALVAAKSIAYSKGASGLQFIEVTKALGIDDIVAKKAVFPALGELVGTLVARGDAEIGIQQVSEFLPVAGIEIVGPLPSQFQKEIVYAVSTFRGNAAGPAARTFAEFLRSEPARHVLRRYGLEPI